MTATGYHASYGGFDVAPQGMPPARKSQWSVGVVAIGCLAMFVALLLTLGGVPAKLFYDAASAGERNRNTSHDMMKMSSSIDRNMKYIRERTAYEPDAYNGLLRSIRTSEQVVPQMAQSVGALTDTVTKIDSSLTQVQATTGQMAEGMTAMAATSAQSAQTMGALQSGVGEISGAMGQLLATTRVLTGNMDAVQAKAHGIATNRTARALQNARELNGVLPAEVPKPTTSLDPGTPAAGGGVPVAGRAVAQ